MAIPSRLLGVEALEEAQVDLLPFHIAFDGPAAISTYFLRRPCPPNLAQGPGELLSAFRGRELHGTPIALPAGYVGRVIQSSAPAFQTVRPANRPTAPSKRRSEASSGTPTAAAKKRRTSPRKSKMTFNLDDSPTSSPVKAEPESSASLLSVELSRHHLPAADGDLVIEGESLTVIEKTEEPQIGVESVVADDKRTIDLRPLYSFNSFMLWSPDGVPVDKGGDPYVRSLDEWIGLSQLIHAY